jgi:hypothetical protein
MKYGVHTGLKYVPGRIVEDVQTREAVEGGPSKKWKPTNQRKR